MMGTPLIKRDGDDVHDLDFVVLQMHCHHRIDGGTSCVRDGSQAEPLASAPTTLDDYGLTIVVDVPSPQTSALALVLSL
jgi:hypothetical protein